MSRFLSASPTFWGSLAPAGGEDGLPHRPLAARRVPGVAAGEHFAVRGAVLDDREERLLGVIAIAVDGFLDGDDFDAGVPEAVLLVEQQVQREALAGGEADEVPVREGDLRVGW